MAVGTALLLAVSLVCAGFVSVAVPDVATRTLSQMFSGADQPNTPFTKDELTSMAVACKHYTFDNHDAAEMNSAIDAANTAVSSAGRSISTTLSSDSRMLDAKAISHLDDVYNVVKTVKPVIIVVLLLTIAGMAHVGVRAGKRTMAGVLKAAACIVFALFVCMLVWGTIDFYGFFNTLHGLLFTGGTWTFNINSLLITMYPTAFWIGMGVCWLVVTCGLSAVCLIVGRRL